jgi:hypothetical protein
VRFVIVVIVVVALIVGDRVWCCRRRRVFLGPPERLDDYVRDTVMVAGKQLSDGDWRSCLTAVQSLNVWRLLPPGDYERVQDVLGEWEVAGCLCVSVCVCLYVCVCARVRVCQ